MLFFVYWHFDIMKNIQLIGLALVFAGSFLPLVHVPIIGNWNYWNVDSSLAIFCWLFSFLAFLGIILGRKSLIIFSSIFLILLFSFSLFAVRYKSEDFFSFLPFENWVKGMAGVVKLKWGWIVEYLGAFLLLIGGMINKTK